MINAVWASMILCGIAFAVARGDAGMITATIFGQAANGLAAALNLLAIIAVWFGLSRIAERSGLLAGLARAIAPLLRPLFPELPKGHPAFSAMAMNLAANVLGLANAATPFGLQAMKQLQELNPRPDTATPAMITFLALNSACATILPATAIALRAQAGAADPNLIIVPAALSSGAAMVGVILIDRWLRAARRR
ncbi:MAG: spore maturation protein [Firmicutes bacterium]|nr:spore maturation protein [Bacillota bacterium]